MLRVSSSSDDFCSGSLSALAGGTTTVVELVAAAEGESLLQALAAAKAEAEENARCNVAFKVQLDAGFDDNGKEDVVEIVKKEGVNAFKVGGSS